MRIGGPNWSFFLAESLAESFVRRKFAYEENISYEVFMKLSYEVRTFVRTKKSYEIRTIFFMQQAPGLLRCKRRTTPIYATLVHLTWLNLKKSFQCSCKKFTTICDICWQAIPLTDSFGKKAIFVCACSGERCAFWGMLISCYVILCFLKYCGISIVDLSWMLLCNSLRRVSFLLFSNDLQPRCCMAFVIHPGSCDLQLVTNLAAVLCTCSIAFMCPFWCGSHAALAYSSIGLTSAMYACALTVSGHWCKLVQLRYRRVVGREHHPWIIYLCLHGYTVR